MALNYLSGLGTSIDDQMLNQFEVVFSAIPNDTSGIAMTDVTLRMDRSIDIPEVKVATYEIEYRGVKLPMIASKEDFDKTFSLNFRVDENWQIFNALNNWYTSSFNESTGAGSAFANTKCNVIFNAYKAGNTVAKTINFENVRIKSIKVETFDHSSGDPSRVECNFIYTWSDLGVL